MSIILLVILVKSNRNIGVNVVNTGKHIIEILKYFAQSQVFNLPHHLSIPRPYLKVTFTTTNNFYEAWFPLVNSTQNNNKKDGIRNHFVKKTEDKIIPLNIGCFYPSFHQFTCVILLNIHSKVFLNYMGWERYLKLLFICTFCSFTNYCVERYVFVEHLGFKEKSGFYIFLYFLFKQ